MCSANSANRYIVGSLSLLLPLSCLASPTPCPYDNHTTVSVASSFSPTDYDDAAAFVRAHALVRAKIQTGAFGEFPRPARKLPKLLWDEDLAEDARQWLGTCPKAVSGDDK